MVTSNKRDGHWLLWWRVGNAEIARGVASYKFQNPLKTSRGVAALCLILSAAMNFAAIYFNLMDFSGFYDAGIGLLLAIFIYIRHRWALVGAMIYWSLEKAIAALGVIAALVTNTGEIISAPALVSHFVWWAVYMHIFYIALKVDQKYRATSAIEADTF